MAEENVTRANKPSTGFIGVIVVLVIALLILFNSFYTVSPQERAVVLTFGRYETTKESGLHFKIPFIQKVYKVNTEERYTMTFGYDQQSGMDSITRSNAEESLLLTGDSNILDIRWNIQYKITNPSDWLFNVDNDDVRDDRGRYIDNRFKTIRDISLSVINQIIGDSSLNRIFEGNRAILVDEALAEMNKKIANVGLGVSIIQVEFETVAAPSGAVQEAFNDVTAATLEKNRLIDEGNVYESQQLPRVEGEAKKVRALADGYAIERVNLANGDVAKFRAIYEEFRKNEDITRKRMYYEMMEELAKGSAEIELIDKDLTNFIPFKDLTKGGNQ